MESSVTSEDLHLRRDAESVVETDRLRDVNAGMNPCYYLRDDDHVKCSTSVTSLVFETGDFVFNGAFDPPDFISTHDMRDSADKSSLLRLANRVLERAPERAEHAIRSVYESRTDYQPPWYVCWETIDKRIRKLKPFEQVTPDGATSTLTRTGRLRSKRRLVERTAETLTRYVRRIEEEFPNHEHVILAGGKDSLLVTLVEKRTPERWNVFSADPNFDIVERFLDVNNIDYGEAFRDDNRNRESSEETVRKIVDSDLYSDPRHFRWVDHLAEVGDRLGPCVFWTGMEGDTINAYHPDYHGRGNFFDLQFTRALSWQGNHMQVMKNYVDSPFLSAYHGPEMWEEVYRHYDPAMMEQGDDVRDDIGRELYGEEVSWPARNPGPAQYSYRRRISAYESYVNHILDRLI